MAETAQLTVKLDLEGNLTSGIGKAQKQLAGLSKSVGRVGKGIGQVGAGFGRAGLLVGGAAVAGLGAAAKAAIDFEDAFAGVRKTVDEADLAKAGLSFESLSRTFRDMATEIPIAATEFARLGETAGALGVKAGDIDDFVKVTALLGVTTDLSADAAADALGRIGTILKFTGKDYENFADSLVALGNAGASTESEIIEITKRFAAEGNAAGLATGDIAGLASATASLGFAPERGGTALARVFANMGTNISLANDKGKSFAKITGRSIKDLQGSIDKGKGLGIFLDVLEGIKGLSPTQANRTLKALGITNTSDRTIFRTMSENLPFVTEQLGIAADATGALSEEATKRFDTIRSKILLLKNNLIEAGITIGEGFAPAIGRAAVKLSEFLKQDANKSALKSLGEDIGKSIDSIDWEKVLDGARSFVGVMKSAVSVVLDILSAVNKLPTEIKAAAAALLVLNKASGGLIGAGVGNIVGGVAETAIRGLGSKLPGVGSLFAQPVFVTNFPLGFGAGGGVPGVVGAAGTAVVASAAAAAAIAFAAIAASIVGAVNSPLWVKNTTLATELEEKGLTQPERAAQQYYTASAADQAQIRKRLAFLPSKADFDSGNLKLAKLLKTGPLGASPSNLPQLNTPYLEPPTPVWVPHRHDANGRRIAENTPPAPGAVKTIDTAMIAAALARTAGETKQKLAEAATAARETTRETTRGATLTAATTRTGSAAIVGAIYANRPDIDVVVNVSGTTVSKTIVKKERYGPSGGSRNRDALGSSGLLTGGR